MVNREINLDKEDIGDMFIQSLSYPVIPHLVFHSVS